MCFSMCFLEMVKWNPKPKTGITGARLLFNGYRTPLGLMCVLVVFILCFERSLGDDVFTMEKTFCNYCLFLNLSVSVHR